MISSSKIRARSRRALLTALIVAGALAQASCRRHGAPERRAPESAEAAAPRDMSKESGVTEPEAVAESGPAVAAPLESSPAVADPGEPVAPPSTGERAGEAALGEEAPADPCVDDCLRRSQMRAVAWEQIQRDCAAECRGTRAEDAGAASR